jgi:hypothetical protein
MAADTRQAVISAACDAMPTIRSLHACTKQPGTHPAVVTTALGSTRDRRFTVTAAAAEEHPLSAPTMSAIPPCSARRRWRRGSSCSGQLLQDTVKRCARKRVVADPACAVQQLDEAAPLPRISLENILIWSEVKYEEKTLIVFGNRCLWCH